MASDVEAAMEATAWAIMHANDGCDHTLCRAPDPRNLDRSCLAQRITEGLADTRRQAVEECARLVEVSSMNLLVEWGLGGIVAERQRNDLAVKIRALLLPSPAPAVEGGE